LGLEIVLFTDLTQRIKMDIQRETADKYQGLFNLMSKEHNLILTISEMDEIIIEAQKVVNKISSKPVLGDSGCYGCKHFDNCGIRMDYGNDGCDEKE